MAEQNESDQQRGRLGRLFAALVGNDELIDVTAGDAGAGAGAETQTSGAPALDLDALSARLAATADPIGVLKAFVADVRSRSEADGAGVPTGLELYLATRLAEAGIDEREVELPTVRVVRPHTSDLFYLRIEDAELPWLSKVAALRVESALNGALLATRALEDAQAASLEELVRCEQRTARSIVAQAPRVAALAGAPALGEWAVREALSFGIESLQLPHRLTARFRANVAEGLVGIEIDLVPPRAWPQTAYVDGLGVVAATPEMRRRAASDYNLRLGALLASYALRVAPEVREVWVAGVVDSARSHACYYSARLTRELLDELDLGGSFDPVALMRAAGAALDESHGELASVAQGFSLDDERLCPPERYDPVELSERALVGAAARELGCANVRELGIDEAAARRAVARELTRQLGGSTAENVRALLAAGGEGASEDVREAALRCVRALIDGELADDPLAIEEALVSGDELTRAVSAARERLLAQDAPAAERLVLDALRPLEERGAYADEGELTWRSFGSYAERALYNRIVRGAGEQVRLVPAAYLEAQVIASVCAIAQGRGTEACARARRACELAPLSSQASLNLAQCLEATGDVEGALCELRRMLSLAHTPDAVGFGYLKMSQIQWQAGRVLAAQACYQRACRYLGAPALVAGLAVVALLGHVGEASDGSLTPDQADAALRGADIPLAPTEPVLDALVGAARASVDEGLFGVAREVVHALCSIARDDVTFGTLRSLEAEPDR